MSSSLSISEAVPDLCDKHPNMSKALETGPQCALAVDSPWTNTSTAAMQGFLQKQGMGLSTNIPGPAAPEGRCESKGGIGGFFSFCVTSSSERRAS